MASKKTYDNKSPIGLPNRPPQFFDETHLSDKVFWIIRSATAYSGLRDPVIKTEMLVAGMIVAKIFLLTATVIVTAFGLCR